MPEGVSTKDAWSSPAAGTWADIRMGWAVATWAIAEAILLAVTVTTFVLFEVFGGLERAFEIAFWGTAIASFVIFLVVLRSRLPFVRQGRFFNSIVVAVLHLVAVGVLFGAMLVVNAVWGRFDVVEGFMSLERTAALVLFASLLAPAILPERGDVPDGTQRVEPDETHRL